mmetsp:Transcript_117536/g.226768  ORF Transcript_117536/g.226768 Transcript_117536/m.226768 type:complete len:630 (-) Transcript_117536:20-1909(-)
MADDRLAELRRKAVDAEEKLAQLDLKQFHRRAEEAEAALTEILERNSEQHAPEGTSASNEDAPAATVAEPEEIPAVSSLPGMKLSAQHKQSGLERLRKMRQLLAQGPSAAAAALNPHAAEDLAADSSGLEVAQPMGNRSEEPSGPDTIDSETIACANLFVEQWKLDWRSLGMLQSLPRAVLVDVMASFSPPEGTFNINASFSAFIKKKTDEHDLRKKTWVPGDLHWQRTAWTNTGPSLEESVRFFTSSWGFAEEEVQMLMSLPTEICWGVIGTFTPPPGTTDLAAALRRYVQGRMEQVSTQNNSIQAFVAHWGLNYQSEGLLRSLPPEQQLMVMDKFRPPRDTSNTSGKFHAFVRSIIEYNNPWKGKGSGKASGNSWCNNQDAVTQFVWYWNLDNGAETYLRKFPVTVRNRMMDEWQPGTNTVNISGRFTAYIRSKLKEWGINEDGNMEDYVGQDFGKFESGVCSASGFMVKEFNEVAQFISYWMLGEEAERLLRSLPERASRDLIASFAPAPNTPDYTGSFMTFARARLDELGLGKQQTTPGKLLSRPLQETQDFPADKVTEFVLKWGLDSASENHLRNLDEDVRNQVLSGFNPGAGTRNPNARLAAWIRRLTALEGVAKQPRLDEWS